MDRHAATRWHAGLRIAAIRRHAGLRIAGAQDLEEPALRYQVEIEVNGGYRGSYPTCWACAATLWRSLFPPDGQVQGLRSVQGSAVQGRQAQACRRAWRGAPWQCKGWDADWGLLLTTTSLLNGGLVHTRAPCYECACLDVLRIWCLLSGQFAVQNCPGTIPTILR